MGFINRFIASSEFLPLIFIEDSLNSLKLTFLYFILYLLYFKSHLEEFTFI